MTLSASKKASNKKYDDEHMAYQTVKLKKATLEEFRRIVQQNGDKVNTVLRQAIENYIKEHSHDD